MDELITQLPKWETLPAYNAPDVLTVGECIEIGGAFGSFLGLIIGIPAGLITGSFVTGFMCVVVGMLAGIIVVMIADVVGEGRAIKAKKDTSNRLRIETVVKPGVSADTAALIVQAVDQQGRDYCRQTFTPGEDVEASEYTSQLQAAINDEYEAYQERTLNHVTAVADLEGTRSAITAAL